MPSLRSAGRYALDIGELIIPLQSCHCYFTTPNVPVIIDNFAEQVQEHCYEGEKEKCLQQCHGSLQSQAVCVEEHCSQHQQVQQDQGFTNICCLGGVGLGAGKHKEHKDTRVEQDQLEGMRIFIIVHISFAYTCRFQLYTNPPPELGKYNEPKLR